MTTKPRSPGPGCLISVLFLSCSLLICNNLELSPQSMWQIYQQKKKRLIYSVFLAIHTHLREIIQLTKTYYSPAQAIHSQDLQHHLNLHDKRASHDNHYQTSAWNKVSDVNGAKTTCIYEGECQLYEFKTFTNNISLLLLYNAKYWSETPIGVCWINNN